MDVPARRADGADTVLAGGKGDVIVEMNFKRRRPPAGRAWAGSQLESLLEIIVGPLRQAVEGGSVSLDAREDRGVAAVHDAHRRFGSTPSAAQGELARGRIETAI